MQRLFTRENLLALGLCLLVILLIIVTADAGPTFIYQRFEYSVACHDDSVQFSGVAGPALPAQQPLVRRSPDHVHCYRFVGDAVALVYAGRYLGAVPLRRPARLDIPAGRQ